MKRFLLFLIIVTIFIKETIAQTPVAYYPFNGNANDSVNSNNGVLINNPASVNDRHGVAGSAYAFNGSNQYINVPHHATLQLITSLTLTAWIKRTAFGIDIILEKGGDWTTGTCNYGISLHNANNNMFYFYFNGGWRGTGGVSDFNWHHYAVAATNGAANPELYIDGVQKTVQYSGGNASINLFAAVSNLHIGAQVGSISYYSSNIIDEVKIYDVALSATQIQTEFLNSKYALQPGSGNALSFDGIDDRILVPHSNSINTVNFTVAAWIKTLQPTTGSNDYYRIVYKQTGSGQNYSLAVHQNKAHIRFDHGGGTVEANSITTVNDGKWHHIAGIYDQSSLQIYVDGILENSSATTAVPFTSSDPMYIGAAGNFTTQNYEGMMDEVVVYNTALSQTQLRERMCRKVTSADVLFANLIAYYNFDETSGTIANDATINNNNGTLINGPVIITSGAPIGNTSAFNYSATPTTTLTHPQGESLQATATNGSPTGIHVYNINEKPNKTTGAIGAGNNDRYFGVFVVGGTSPQYTATYNYTGNPFVHAGNEANLLLHKRDDNAAPNWINSNAVLNTAANTLTATGQNTEYILGLITGTLPVTMIGFTASKQQDKVLLQWKTANEQNNRGFEIQWSGDGINFTKTGWVNGAGNSSTVQNYHFTHTMPAKGKNFYRLNQIDLDGSNRLSDIRKVDFEATVDFTVYPNPVITTTQVQLNENAAMIKLLDITGKELWRKEKNKASTSVIIPMQHFSGGIYLLQVTNDSGEAVTQKIIKQ